MPNAIGRRAFSALILGSAAATLLPSSAAFASLGSSRALSFRNIHNGETGTFHYIQQGEVNAEALQGINHLLRDWRTGDVAKMDIKLLDLLSQIQHQCGGDCRFEVISAYRSPASNSMLASRSRGVAKGSYHMQAKAIDIAVPNVNVHQVHKTAKALKAGGVGLYTASGFVHVDTGPVRYW